jgi:hypothetical protein
MYEDMYGHEGVRQPGLSRPGVNSQKCFGLNVPQPSIIRTFLLHQLFMRPRFKDGRILHMSMALASQDNTYNQRSQKKDSQDKVGVSREVSEPVS